MRRFIYIAYFVFLTGCATAPVSQIHTFIRDTTYVVLPPAIIDSGAVQTVTDTLVQYVRVQNNDTIVDIRYLPIERLIKYKVQPDTIRLTARDTLVKSEVIEKIIETTMWEKFVIGALGATIALIAIALTALWKKKNG
jgi:hypothetical protein